MCVCELLSLVIYPMDGICVCGDSYRGHATREKASIICIILGMLQKLVKQKQRPVPSTQKRTFSFIIFFVWVFFYLFIYILFFYFASYFFFYVKALVGGPATRWRHGKCYKCIFFFFHTFNYAILFRMADLVVEIIFRFAKFASLDPVKALWSFKRVLGVLGRPKMVGQHRTFNTE